MKCIKNYSDLETGKHYVIYFPKLEPVDNASLFVFMYNGHDAEIPERDKERGLRHLVKIHFFAGKTTSGENINKDGRLIHNKPANGIWYQKHPLMSEAFIYELEPFEVMAEII